MNRYSAQLLRIYMRNNKPIRLASTNTDMSSNENAPIKFSTSPAAKRAVASVFKKQTKNDIPWYQPFSIVGSLTVFLIYFCVLREENTIDQEFNKTLYDRIKGLEKSQLLQSYKYNQENGLSVEEIEKRLKEIEAEEAHIVA